MLTENQEKYILTIPESKMATVYPFNEDITRIAKLEMTRIKEVAPDLDLLFIGASALKISGQNDIDINVLANPKDFDKYIPKLNDVLGEPSFVGTSIEWTFVLGGYELTVYLTDKDSEDLRNQIRVFEALNENQTLLKEYENLKEKLNGSSYREYQRQKYEFYNKILAQ